MIRTEESFLKEISFSATSKSLCIQIAHISLVFSFITAYSQGSGQGHSGRVLPSIQEALDSVVQHHKMK